MNLTCRRCGKPFEGKGNRRYCSDECAEAALKEKKAQYQKEYHRRLKDGSENKRECKCCKKIFPAVRAQLYCDECRATDGMTLREIKKRKKPIPKPKMSLVEVAKAAKAAGMTYGEYVTKMEAG